jgi:hypothetical protein
MSQSLATLSASFARIVSDISSAHLRGPLYQTGVHTAAYSSTLLRNIVLIPLGKRTKELEPIQT